MKKLTQFQTFRAIAAIAWLLLVPATSHLVAQSFFSAEEALEEAENSARQIQSTVVECLNLLPELQDALLKGDFRAQTPLFRKAHQLLHDIENESIALGNSAESAERMDPRLDLAGIREGALFIGTNEDYASLSLLDVAAALHEDDLALAEDALKEAETALMAIRTFALIAQDGTRVAIRSL